MSSVWSIRRSTADKKLAGVCGGVARHWNVDPVLVRVGWALLALSGGVGIVLYVAAWLLVPADGAASSTMDDLTKGQTSGWPREAWVAIVAVACLITFVVFSSTTSDRLRAGCGAGADLVLRLLQDPGQAAAPPVTRGPPSRSTARVTRSPPAAVEPFRYPGPPTPFTEAAEAWRQRVEDMRRSHRHRPRDDGPAARRRRPGPGRGPDADSGGLHRPGRRTRTAPPAPPCRIR